MTCDHHIDRSATSVATTRQSLIEQTLRQLLAGELTPSDATRSLLTECSTGAQAPQLDHATPRLRLPSRGAGESLQALIERLGPPPPEIVDAWCDRWRTIAAQHEAVTSQPLPPIDLQCWSLLPSGNLAWHDRAWQDRLFTRASSSPPDSFGLSETSRRRIEAARRLLLADNSRPQPVPAHFASAQPDPAPSDAADPKKTQPNATQPNATQPNATQSDAVSCSDPDRSSRCVATGTDSGNVPISQPESLVSPAATLRNRKHDRRAGKWSAVHHPLAAAAVVIGFAAGGVAWWQAGPPRPRRTIRQESSHTDPGAEAPATGSKPSPRSKPRRPREQASSSSRKGTSDALEASASPAAGDALADSTNTFSDDAATTFSDDAMNAFSDATSIGEPLTAEASKPFSSAEDASKLEIASTVERTSEPAETPQPTRARKNAAVELLPASDRPAAVTLFPPPAPQSLRLEFPYDVPLRLRATDSAAGWAIERVNTKSESPALLARLFPKDRRLMLRWTATAADNALAHQLTHGRLIAGAGERLYLRPVITAEPVAIRLDTSDVRPTWDLRHPLPPGAGRLSIDFELPEEMQLGWIERLEETSPRRSRAVALFSQNDETVALGVRLDVRCRRQLSIRIRYAARLDRSLPWQITSHDHLAHLKRQLADRLVVLETQSAQMAALYGQADSEEKRVLKPRRDRIEQTLESHRRLAKRATELEGLIRAVEASGSIHVQLSVAWSDDTQTILTTRQDPAATFSRPTLLRTGA